MKSTPRQGALVGLHGWSTASLRIRLIHARQQRYNPNRWPLDGEAAAKSTHRRVLHPFLWTPTAPDTAQAPKPQQIPVDSSRYRVEERHGVSAPPPKLCESACELMQRRGTNGRWRSQSDTMRSA